jgi:hypothetical protein
MRVPVKIIEVIRGFWSDKQECLAQVHMHLNSIPEKNDIIYLNDTRYKIVQKDYIYKDKVETTLDLETLRLFIEKW